MTIHNCIGTPCTICAANANGGNVVTATATTGGTLWNGGSCGICGALYLGSHECSVTDLLRRSDDLRDMALRRFKELNPQPTRGPNGERTVSCPCRPENGGNGVCNCTLGGPEVTC